MRGMPKHGRRDNNDHDLVTFARQFGWRCWKLDQPCDYLALRRGVWYALEIKNPECEGHAEEYTYDQRKFLAEVAAVGGRVLVWRTRGDVMQASNARVSA